MLPPDTDFLEFLLSLPPEAREEAVRRLGVTEAEAFDRDWATWAHDGQRPPAKCADGSDWTTCVIMGGRGFGKTKAGSKWIESLIEAQAAERPRASPPLRIALVGATLAEARRVMVEGPSGLLEVAGPWIREWRPSFRLLKFRTGAEAELFSGHSPELLRGPAHDYAWCDELAKWKKAGETWDMLQLGLRRGDRPRALVTTTPRPGPVLRGIMALPGCVTIGGPSIANPHVSPAWQRDMAARYAGTRLERQELGGELLGDSPGALWTVELLERSRKGDSHFHARSEDRIPGGAKSDCPQHGGSESDCPHFHRIVIAVDPPSGGGTCGIIACARDEAGLGHVLADHSVAALSPEGWSRAVADAANMWRSQCPGVPVTIVAESNQGGQMVQAVLRIADPALGVRPVTATRGKTLRAEPVARLFEAGKVVLHGRFPELEAELLGMIAGGDYEGPAPARTEPMRWSGV